MKVVLAGATGYIGRPPDVPPATRVRAPGAGADAGHLSGAGGPREVETAQWDGRTARPWTDALEGADAIVNLSGANIGAQRWTEERKGELLRSRQQPRARSRRPWGLPAERRPRVLVGASGIDYYGDRGDEEVTEESPPGDSFLARLCVQWEARRIGRRSPSACGWC